MTQRNRRAYRGKGTAVQRRGCRAGAAERQRAETKRWMRSHSVALGVTAVLAVGILAVALDDGRDYDYAGVCVDERTNVRVDDANCRADHAYPYGWYFIHTGRTFPRVGVPALGGSFARPAAGSVHLGGVSTSGGVVTRGGFGHGRLSGGFHGG